MLGFTFDCLSPFLVTSWVDARSVKIVAHAELTKKYSSLLPGPDIRLSFPSESIESIEKLRLGRIRAFLNDLVQDSLVHRTPPFGHGYFLFVKGNKPLNLWDENSVTLKDVMGLDSTEMCGRLLICPPPLIVAIPKMIWDTTSTTSQFRTALEDQFQNLDKFISRPDNENLERAEKLAEYVDQGMEYYEKSFESIDKTKDAVEKIGNVLSMVDLTRVSKILDTLSNFGEMVPFVSTAFSILKFITKCATEAAALQKEITRLRNTAEDLKHAIESRYLAYFHANSHMVIDDPELEKRLMSAMKEAIAAVHATLQKHVEIKSRSTIPSMIKSAQGDTDTSDIDKNLERATFKLLLKDPIHFAIDLRVYCAHLSNQEAKNFWRKNRFKFLVDLAEFEQALEAQFSNLCLSLGSFGKLVSNLINDNHDQYISVDEFQKWLGSQSLEVAICNSVHKIDILKVNDQPIGQGSIDSLVSALRNPSSMKTDLIFHVNSRFPGTRTWIVDYIFRWVSRAVKGTLREDNPNQATILKPDEIDNILMLTAAPGYGKSIIAAIAASSLRDIQKDTVPPGSSETVSSAAESEKILSAVYFFRADKPNRVDMVTSLALQLAEQSKAYRTYLEEITKIIDEIEHLEDHELDTRLATLARLNPSQGKLPEVPFNDQTPLDNSSAPMSERQHPDRKAYDILLGIVKYKTSGADGFYSAHNIRHQFEVLIAAFPRIKALSCPIVITVDSLDECPQTIQAKVFGFIRSFREVAPPNIQLILTSRTSGYIYEQLESKQIHSTRAHLEYNASKTMSKFQLSNLDPGFIQKSVENDLTIYARGLAAKFQMRAFNKSQITEIITKSEGRMLWIKLAINAIRDKMAQGTTWLATESFTPAAELDQVFRDLLQVTSARMPSDLGEIFPQTISTVLVAFEAIGDEDLRDFFYYSHSISMTQFLSFVSSQLAQAAQNFSDPIISRKLMPEDYVQPGDLDWLYFSDHEESPRLLLDNERHQLCCYLASKGISRRHIVMFLDRQLRTIQDMTEYLEKSGTIAAANHEVPYILLDPKMRADNQQFYAYKAIPKVRKYQRSHKSIKDALDSSQDSLANRGQAPLRLQDYHATMALACLRILTEERPAYHYQGSYEEYGKSNRNQSDSNTVTPPNKALNIHLRLHWMMLSTDRDASFRSILPFSVEYACKYWADHLFEVIEFCSNHGSDDSVIQASHNDVPLSEFFEAYPKLLQQFATTTILYWIQVMARLGQLFKVPDILQNAQYLKGITETTRTLLKDVQRMLRKYQIPILEDPADLYRTILAQCPLSSELRQHLLPSESHCKIVIALQGSWGTRMATFKSQLECVATVAFSPDENYLVSCCDDSLVKVWELSTTNYVSAMEGHDEGIWNIDVSHDGCLLASCGDDRTIRIWDFKTGELLRTLEGHADEVIGVCISKDGKKIVSSSGDKTVKIWDSESGKCIKTLKGHEAPVRFVKLSADGKTIASSSQDGCVILWNWETETSKKLRSPDDNKTTKSINPIAFISDDKFLAIGVADGSVQICSIETGKIEQVLHNAFSVRSLAYCPINNRIAVGLETSNVNIWDLETKECIRCLKGEGAPNWSVNFSPSGELLATSDEVGHITIWELSNKEIAAENESAKSDAHCLELSSKGNICAVARYNGTVEVWTCADHRSTDVPTPQHLLANSLTISPDEKLLAARLEDGTAVLWDLPYLENARYIEGLTGTMMNILFSKDSRFIMTLGNKFAKVFDVNSMEVPVAAGGRKTLKLATQLSAYEISHLDRDCLIFEEFAMDKELEDMIKEDQTVPELQLQTIEQERWIVETKTKDKLLWISQEISSELLRIVGRRIAMVSDNGIISVYDLSCGLS
ncbi:uncharacterized protein BJ171DRAFT_585147 [Polychytrium aggregatum]|uniref:uncharacterized protein n=1 Tax=Polychytrium aggregatum TaxID=110093 RepID=UPI0022FE0BD0|nr:uncharacterized protein BJ171DRAFT_585147 [Polychytrium aggregatum]KAI9199596.1 hypothetical protein BJ171DRAFT_585147 [Polychytrium aggregatum]